MAEIVASGMGIATFGITTIKTIIEVKQLSSSAPGHLSQIIEEVARLSTLLVSLETQQAEFAQYIIPSPALNECTQHCESAARELEETANSLKNCIKKRKLHGTLKTILKKELIAKQEQKLDRAKTDLLIAQQMLISAAQYQQLLQSSRTNNAFLCSVQPMSRIDSPVTKSADVDVGTPCKASMSLQRVSSRGLHKRERQNDQGICLRISSSWLRILWEVHITNASNTFGIQLRMHNTVAEDALVFQYCGMGDVNGLRRLFGSDSKTASVHDRDHVWGRTPLHVAIENWQVEAARFLLQQGADIEASVLRHWHEAEEVMTCFRLFWEALPVHRLFSGKRSLETEIQGMLNLLTVEYETEDVLLNHFEDYFHHGYAFRTSSMAFAVAAPQIYTVHKQRHISDRLELAMGSYSTDLQNFWCLLGQASIDEDCRAAISQKGPERLMCQFAQQLRDSITPDRFVENMEGWRQLLREAVQLVAQTPHFRESPLDAYLRYRGGWKLRNAHLEVKFVQDALRRWLRELQLAGQDLLRYGELEHEAFREGTSYLADLFTFECYPIQWWKRYINFSFGPQVEDWHFFISWPFDEWAGDFWQSLEVDFQPPMPGSWVEEEAKDNLAEAHEFGAHLLEAKCSFRTLATSRRKRRRYLRWTGMTEKEAAYCLGSSWTGVIEDNRSRAGKDMDLLCSRTKLPSWALQNFVTL
ncbi:hypothetical protein GJ744_007993 [Endocarpon pusillum]|uniref:Fungal N-terminal domain-containing protein n=1 Tax=Endocarpon pusillum TaxID=364733 RepID=A0A8H7AHY0_9EURO|nr:hypothetical protein GJ744_007993 [Endocarpon pusillum]